MRKHLSTLLKKHLPGLLRRQIFAPEWVEHELGQKVAFGPFKGMIISNSAEIDCRHARLLGCFEIELRSWIESLVGRKGEFDVHAHVGAADGYYAIGFSKAWPDIPCAAFEMIPSQEALLKKNAEVNGVASNLRTLGKADPTRLRQALEPFSRPFVVMDVEGAEDLLLDPNAIPPLANATILLEIHHWCREGLRDELLARMEPTHTAILKSSRPRTLADLPIQPPMFMRLFRREAARLLLEENRGYPMEWALFEPR